MDLDSAIFDIINVLYKLCFLYVKRNKRCTNHSENMNSLIYILVPWESKTIPKPTPAQLKYQKNEIMALIHFNMATFAKDGDPGCSADNWNVHQKYASGPTYVL